MALPISIQGVDNPRDYEPRTTGRDAYLGIYYDKHLDKVMTYDTMRMRSLPVLNAQNSHTGFIDERNDKNMLNWTVPDLNDESHQHQFRNELHRNDFRAISDEVLREYDEKRIGRLYVKHCGCQNCASPPAEYNLIYSAHDRKLRKIFCDIPESTDHLTHTMNESEREEDDEKTVHLYWRRTVPDPVNPGKGRIHLGCDVLLEDSVFMELGTIVQRDFKEKRIERIYVEQHYPCLACDYSATLACRKYLTDDL